MVPTAPESHSCPDRSDQSAHASEPEPAPEPAPAPEPEPEAEGEISAESGDYAAQFQAKFFGA